MFIVTSILKFIPRIKCLSETNWCVILAFRVSSKYRLREPDGHVCLCKSATHSKRPLKNLGWHHQVHILFVQLYALWIEFQLKTWVNKSSTRTHTNLWVNTQTWVCVHTNINIDKHTWLLKGHSWELVMWSGCGYGGQHNFVSLAVWTLTPFQ